jgi:uncharacterized protein YfaS (alpha-2-macroglobulin family)
MELVVEFLDLPGERIPLTDSAVDTVKVEASKSYARAHGLILAQPTAPGPKSNNQQIPSNGFPHPPAKGALMRKKPKATEPGTVQKVIKPYLPDQPEKAEIKIPSADDLYREIRIENTLTDEKGEEVKLKPGADVDVSVEADINATEPKETSKTSLPEKKR